MAARTNLIPTPYAIKMALLRVYLEQFGRQLLPNLDSGVKAFFQQLRDLEVRILPPTHVVVNRNGYKLRYYDQTTDKADKSRQTMALQGGFVFREWIHYQGMLQICCGSSDAIAPLMPLFAQINYFGKRGCFFQYLPEATLETDTLPAAFASTHQDAFFVHPLDDLGAKATFANINPYSPKRAKLGSDRVIPNQFLPLQLRASGAHYDWYESVNGEL
jgi:hypothetical protein